MSHITDTELKVDVLIIGTEAAGAKAAIEARNEGAKVLAVSKGVMGRSGTTVMAGFAVQAPLGHADPRDNPEVFFSDVIKGGAYLNNQKLVEQLTNLANSEVVKMEEWGAKFIKTKEGKFVQRQLPGSSYPRSLSLAGSRGGLQWQKALGAEFRRQGIVPLEDFFVTKLLLSNGQVAGVVGISLADGQIIVLRGKTTILTTGGCGQLFRHTDMPSGATGDGMALALNAGVELMDMEFHQFFPYHCYGPPGRENIPIGTLRYSLHAKLYNSRGEEFLENYIPLSKGWALRDVTSRSIYLENKAGRGSPCGGAYLSVGHLPANMVEDTLRNVAPRLARKVKEVGMDLSREAFEIGPVVHYTMGGIRVNEQCDTSLPRLIAAGENAAGMDGAERIDGGPAICWCLTMGYIAGKRAAAKAQELDWLPIDKEQVVLEKKRLEAFYSRSEGIKGHEVKNKIKDIMWEKCGLIRDKAGLEEGLSLIQDIKGNDLPRLFVPGPSRCFNVGLVDVLEAENMVDLAEVFLSSALMRQETRQSHYRSDYPTLNNRDWLRNIIVRKLDNQNVFNTIVPLMHKMQPPSEEVQEVNYG